MLSTPPVGGEAWRWPRLDLDQQVLPAPRSLWPSLLLRVLFTLEHMILDQILEKSPASEREAPSCPWAPVSMLWTLHRNGGSSAEI